ncbi:MAG: hypothetical protein KJ709_04725 [Nanoarchaeota archaeon]|nr:hypothetical protein [Nanoarchaeota archaeon]
MPYDIDRKACKIRITGSTDEISAWIRALDTVITRGTNISQLEEYLHNLEERVEPIQYTFGQYERILFNNDSILYGPNASKTAGESFFESLIVKHFEAARRLIEE